jgi:tyrosinase
MTSPGDPIFYFHHAALDRLWWIWQMQDPAKRLNAIPTATMPPMHRYRHRARQADPTNKTVDMAWLGPEIPLLETHDQLGGNGGAFCYIYV